MVSFTVKHRWVPIKYFIAQSQGLKEKKGKKLFFDNQPIAEGFVVCLLLARRSSISAENFKSPTWLLARYQQPNRARPFRDFRMSLSRDFGNSPECSMSPDPAAPPQTLLVRSTRAGQTQIALPICNPMPWRKYHSLCPRQVQRDRDTCKNSSDPLVNWQQPPPASKHHFHWMN